jgi:T5SS/PEP-CTERM-associated repeat protein
MWAGIQTAAGQYTSNYQTNTISYVTNYWAGDYVVGSNTFADALVIQNKGVLSNADGYVGYLLASSSNYVLVAGNGSVWSNADLYLGFSGSGNTMLISNAGCVAANVLTYVADNATSSSNHVLVTGTNSIWNCGSDFFLGYSGSANSLVISNGGQVVNGLAYVGELSSSSNNSALVTGTNSVWNNSACLIGDSGSNSKLIINKGGRVVCNYAHLGFSAPSSGNTAWVSDSNSVWDVSAAAAILNVGLNGPGNSLVVTNGGQVLGYYFYVGNSSSSNSALVTGPGSSLSVNCYVYTGNQGDNNTLSVANGAAVSDKFCYISYVAGSSNNTVLITDPNSSWQNSDSVFDGFDGGAGNLIISNGATLAGVEGVLGYDPTSSNNNAVVTGSASTWNCSDNTYVGYEGPVNSLVISNGGWVIGQSGVAGFGPGSYGNSVMVVGTGSIWTNYDEVYVGYSGSGNSLVISNGGQVLDYDGYLGSETNGCSNQALITGAGSVWSNADAVLVGDFGASNILVIGSGGLVYDYWGLVGEDDSGSNNTVFVEPGGVWNNQQLAVGDLGSQNALYVEGGLVFATNMEVGYNSLYCNNLVQLDSGQIFVTNSTAGGVLEVYDGTFVLNGGTLRVDTLIVTNDCAQFRHVGGTLIYKTLQLNPNQSAVGDGIPNWWKLKYGFDPLDPTVASADPDHDGENNLEEYLAGTNPTNAASVFHIISVVKTNNDVCVTWSTVGGHSYVMQTNGNLGTATFADFSPVISVGGTNEGITNYLDGGAATNYSSRFYRIRLGP